MAKKSKSNLNAIQRAFIGVEETIRRNPFLELLFATTAGATVAVYLERTLDGKSVDFGLLLLSALWVSVLAVGYLFFVLAIDNEIFTHLGKSGARLKGLVNNKKT